MKDSRKQSTCTRRPSQPSAEEKLIAVLERELAEARRANAKLLRLVEMAMEERYYRPTVTGGVRENAIPPGLPLESLNDVATFDEDADAALSNNQNAAYEELEHELCAIESEHRGWRAEKGLADEEAAPAA